MSGFQYLAAELPRLEPFIAPAACGALVVLGLLNYIGIRESAVLTAVLAVAFAVGEFGRHGGCGGAPGRGALAAGPRSILRGQGATPWPILVGFGSSWLAFSGLESISQIAPALHEPRERTALRAILLVIAAVLITSPLITAFETALLDTARANPDQFLYVLGVDYGNRALALAIVRHLDDAAHRRRQHRAHRLLPRVPGVGAPRLHAAVAGRTQPALRNASSRDPHFGRGPCRRGPCDEWAHGPARRHVFLRAARGVHPDLRRYRPHAAPGEQSGHLVLARDCDFDACGGRVGCEPRVARPRRRFSAVDHHRRFRLRVRGAQRVDRRLPRGLHRCRSGRACRLGARRPRSRWSRWRRRSKCGDVPIVDAGCDPGTESATVPGGIGALARRGRCSHIRHLRGRDSGAVFSAEELARPKRHAPSSRPRSTTSSKQVSSQFQSGAWATTPAPRWQARRASSRSRPSWSERRNGTRCGICCEAASSSRWSRSCRLRLEFGSAIDGKGGLDESHVRRRRLHHLTHLERHVQRLARRARRHRRFGGDRVGALGAVDVDDRVAREKLLSLGKHAVRHG